MLSGTIATLLSIKFCLVRKTRHFFSFALNFASILNNNQYPTLELSIVIPLYNEVESLPILFQELEEVCANYNYEVIAIDDGSSDNSWQVIEEWHKKNNRFKGIRFRRNLGKTAALNAGFREAKGEVVITMDADLQDNPNEIPELKRMITEENYDLVSGWKKKRYDPVSKTIPSKFFNTATRITTGIPLHDFNCGLKAYHHPVVQNIDLRGEMHRYIPVLAKQAGFTNIGEKEVEHRKREYGTTKFGIERFFNGFFDLMTVNFLSKFGNRPMHFFGIWGIVAFSLGLVSVFILAIQKMIQIQQNDFGHLVSDSAWFYIALTLMIIGSQLFLAGYLGELISRQNSAFNEEHIQERLL